MLHPIRRILLHLSEHIAYDSRVVVGCLFGTRDVDCYVGELGPGEGVVEVVFHEIAIWCMLALLEVDEGKGMEITFRGDW
jgi:hypothetical protein